MKINAAQFVCIINLQSGPPCARGGGGGIAARHRRYFKHGWLLGKIDRKFQLFRDKPARTAARIIRGVGAHYPRINAITGGGRGRPTMNGAVFRFEPCRSLAVPRRFSLLLLCDPRLPSNEIFHSIVNREGTRYTREVSDHNAVIGRVACPPQLLIIFITGQRTSAYPHPTRCTVNICLDIWNVCMEIGGGIIDRVEGDSWWLTFCWLSSFPLSSSRRFYRSYFV